MTASNTYGRQVVVVLTNKSGGGVIAGDVVVIDTANNAAFTTTTSAGVTGLVGIAQETIGNNAAGRVLINGYAALVNVNASVTRGDFGATHTVAKQATDVGAVRAAGTFCQFLTGGTTPDATIWPTDLGGGSGAPTTVDYLVGTASGGLSAEIVVGTSPGGELGGTWASPTVDGTHSGSSHSDFLPWHIFVPCAAATPEATTGTWAQSNPGDVASIYAGMIANSGSNAQNDAIAWDIVLAAGTWDVHFWVRRSTNTAIITLNFDGVSKGTVDTYNGSADYFKASVTAIAVAATAKIRVQAKAATRNGSNSTGWVLGLFAVEFRRTA